MGTVNPARIYASKEIVNNAGGTAFEISKWDRLDRYLIIGSEGGTYYVNEKKLTRDNAKNVVDCIKENGIRVVQKAIKVSDKGLAPKNDQAIFVMALAMSEGDVETRIYARENLSKVVRTASHLTMFVDYVTALRGWGKALKRGISDWFNTIGMRDKNDVLGNISALAYQMMKYSNRNGYTQRDILRLAHVHPTNAIQSTLFSCITKPESMPAFPDEDAEQKVMAVSVDLYKYAMAKQLGKYDIDKILDLIIRYRLPHEVIPTELKNDPRIWQALLDAGMPINALIRNLGKLSQLGLLEPMSENAKKVCETFRNEEILRRARIHPINVLNQKVGYESGRGRSGIFWQVNSKISAAMEDMFYASFNYVEPTGKNLMLALDVSGSMSSPASGTNLSCCQVTAAMSMTTLRTEDNAEIFAFNNRIERVDITPKSSLQEVLKKVSNINYGGTDCSLPMKYAKDHHLPVDGFAIYTDSETWCNRNYSPAKSLLEYQNKSGKHDAKVAVIACTSTEVGIAEPGNLNMLDVAGFSSSVPQVLSHFFSGKSIDDEE